LRALKASSQPVALLSRIHLPIDKCQFKSHKTKYRNDVANSVGQMWVSSWVGPCFPRLLPLTVPSAARQSHLGPLKTLDRPASPATVRIAVARLAPGFPLPRRTRTPRFWPSPLCQPTNAAMRFLSSVLIIPLPRGDRFFLQGFVIFRLAPI
jgi:hypothetical protein